MCVLSIIVPIRKKSGNLVNEPCTYSLKKNIFTDYPKRIIVFLSDNLYGGTYNT